MKLSASMYQLLSLSIVTLLTASTVFAQQVQLEQGQDSFRPTLLAPAGVKIQDNWIKNNLAPRGSASLTSSGKLAENGIVAILHAATGSMGHFDETTEPTVESVKQSIDLSLQLAEKSGFKKIAVPLIGGGIFLDRLNLTREQLASQIVDAVYKSKAQKIKVVFVAYKDDENDVMSAAHRDYGNFVFRIYKWLLNLANFKPDFYQRTAVVQGSIVDYNVHKASAIVNAANMELQFGGGLSGVIGNATQDSHHINSINADLITKYYDEVK